MVISHQLILMKIRIGISRRAVVRVMKKSKERLLIEFFIKIGKPIGLYKNSPNAMRGLTSLYRPASPSIKYEFFDALTAT